MNHRVKILSKRQLNHDVIQFRLEKPSGFSFKAGQATEVIVEDGKSFGPAPFTFTALSTAPYLELMIKIYEEHHGVTAALGRKKEGEQIIIGDPWDSFVDKGPGVYIAGGAGITPFIALMRQQHSEGRKGSHLFFFNKTAQDIFLEDELATLLGKNYVNVITRPEKEAPAEKIDPKLFSDKLPDFKRPMYVCGPPGFQNAIQKVLADSGAEQEMVNISF